MGWNTDNFVLSADGMFNGSPKDHIRDIFEYADLLPFFKSSYQVAVSHELGKLLHTNRNFESLTNEDIVKLRLFDENVISFPVEFYMNLLGKPSHDVDFRGRDVQFMDLVRSNAKIINHIFDHSFRLWHEHGRDIDDTIYEETDFHFGKMGVDDEMLGILKGYFTQKPKRALLFIDLESEPASFPWIESAYRTIDWNFGNFGIKRTGVVSGKGYHIFSGVNLHNQDGGVNPVMIELMSRGGYIHAETIDKCVTTRWGSRKKVPTPLLSQRAYQASGRLVHALMVNIADDIRKWTAASGMNPWVNYTDSEHETVIADLTARLRQGDMSVAGSIGSTYNKSRAKRIVRIKRSQNGFEYFDNDLDEQDNTRSDYHNAKGHLINTGGRIPDGSQGIMNLMHWYDDTRIKRDLFEECDRPLDENIIAWLKETDYAVVREQCPNTNWYLDHPQPSFLDPKDLKEICHELDNAGFAPHEAQHVLVAVYRDPLKPIDEDFTKYSSTEKMKWEQIIMGEHYKG